MKHVEVPTIDWRRRFMMTARGDKPASCSFNVRLILENDPAWQGVLGYCEFSYAVVKKHVPPLRNAARGEVTDGDVADIRHWVAENYGFEPKTTDVIDAVGAAARGEPFHPVREYLEGLKWDGQERLPMWLINYLGASDRSERPEDEDRKFAYLKAVGVKWLVSAVARVMAPPVKVDNVLILEGYQGVGKSTVFKILGGDWFADSHFTLGDKDGYQFLRGVWLVELAELDSLNKAEATRAKQFFGSDKDRYRASFGRSMQEWARQCVFAGTTNQDAYLKDPTGGRRYWPARVENIDLEALRRDRDQLWAEALHRYRAGERWHVMADERELFEAEQEERYNADAWEVLIARALDEKLDEPRQRGEEVFVTMVELFDALKMDPSHMRPPEQQRVGGIMTRLGWRKRRRGIKTARIWGWLPPEDAL